MSLKSDAEKWRKRQAWYRAYAKTPKQKARHSAYYKIYYQRHKEEIIKRVMANYRRKKGA